MVENQPYGNIYLEERPEGAKREPENDAASYNCAGKHLKTACIRGRG